MPHLVTANWDDVPHLTAKQKEDLWAAIPPHERDARSKGVPIMGSGVIFPVSEDVYLCDPIEIPDHWPRAYGLDVGWNKTAAIWGAWDRTADTVYCYSEHYQGHAEPSVHADAIKARGSWIPGAIDPASIGAGQIDGRKLMDEYRKLELLLQPADNAVEAGIHAVYRRLSGGRLKVFRTLANTRSELRLYHRDEHGKVVKQNDHLMDALRYLIMTGMTLAVTMPLDTDEFDDHRRTSTRSATTGY